MQREVEVILKDIQRELNYLGEVLSQDQAGVKKNRLLKEKHKKMHEGRKKNQEISDGIEKGKQKYQ